MEGGRHNSVGHASDTSAAPRPADLEGFRLPLRIFAARRLGDWTAAEDVSQETLRVGLEAMQKGRIKSVEVLPGFLFQTAVHLCMHRGRSAAREKRALERFHPASGEESDSEAHPLETLISAERQAQVREALARLDPEERQVLEWTYREELPSEAIGRKLGVATGAVRMRRHRAIRRLAALLGVTRPPVREFKD